MAVYQRILLAVDLATDSLLIGQRARALAAALDAELEMIHVVEPVPPVVPIPPDPIAPAIVTTQTELIEIAQARIGGLAQRSSACRRLAGVSSSATSRARSFVPPPTAKWISSSSAAGKAMASLFSSSLSRTSSCTGRRATSSRFACRNKKTRSRRRISTGAALRAEIEQAGGYESGSPYTG
jgi:hypothetical protein